jgi:DNA-binding transcriptional MerR regulator
MGQYSIKELEKLSGIRAHTIRIWEKRYSIIEPQRTSTNIRFYSDEDLKRIINVSVLNTHGVKISKIAQMSLEEVAQKVLGLSKENEETNVYIDQLIIAMVDLEEEQFDKILTTISKKVGLTKTITEYIYPFMEKIGILWQTGTITPAHEHFISNLIRQKIIASISALPIPSNKSKKALLFLPEGELHEIGLLFSHYLTRLQGFKTLYLGQSVPYSDLKKVNEIFRPAAMITAMVSSPAADQLENYLQTLAKDFPSVTIFASGHQLRNTAFHIPKNVRPYYKATELSDLLDKL